MDDPLQTERRVLTLEERIRALETCQTLNKKTDECIEVAIQKRYTLSQTLQAIFPLLCEFTGADKAFIRTYDESLLLKDFTWPEDSTLHLTPGELERLPIQGVINDRFVIAQRVDVAGEDFGVAGLEFTDSPDNEKVEELAALLDTWCEEIDNYLAAIALARRKHRVTLALSDALKLPVLEEGIDKAMEVLRTEVHFDKLILVYRPGHYGPDGPVYFRRVNQVLEDDDFLEQNSRRILEGDLCETAQRLHLEQYREEVLISGIKQQEIVGRLLVASDRHQFSTFDREILERFADYLRQRIVDFSREWRHLSLCFPRPLVRRLLHEEDYAWRLEPTERDVAILYCDIASFTRVSEQILQKPPLIGQLINTWGERVVELIWESGGVFDKMVGDCVIGMWGPPFFEMSAEEACSRAAETAVRIREYTNSLWKDGTVPGLDTLDKPLGVSTGLNYCPLFVGNFGPNENYTGFSSGMNNTARLQGVANNNEILCMDTFVSAINGQAQFSEEMNSSVKNVAEPLRYRLLQETL